MQDIFIGVDGGGTKTKILLEDADGRLLAASRSGPANIKTSAQQAWQSIHAGIAEAAALARLKLKDCRLHVGLGLAGVEVPPARLEFLSTPHPFTTLCLDSDAYVACLGVHAGKNGAIIIIGTGVNGFQVEDDVRSQVNGWGFPHADEGGGAWLGMEAMRLAFKAIDGRIESSPLLQGIYAQFDHDLSKMVTWANQAKPSEFGSLAPLIIEQARQGDAHGEQLLKQAAAEIDLIADALQNKARQALPLGLLGGLAAFIEPRLSPAVRARIVPRQYDATKGAILMIRRQFADNHPGTARQNPISSGY